MNLHLNITQDVGHGITVMFLCSVLVIFSVLLDLYTGVRAAKALKEKIRSRILRRTIKKITDYLVVVFFGILIDVLGLCFPWYAIPYCCIVATLGVILIEGKSVIENHTRIKSSAAKVPEMIGDIAEKIIKCDNIKDAMELVEKMNKK